MKKQFSPKDIEDVLATIKQVIAYRFKEKGWQCYNSLHECWGILDEEVIEFKQAVHDNEKNEALKELIDIATAAILGIASEV